MILQDFDDNLGITVSSSRINQICDETVFYEGLGCAAVNVVYPFDDSCFNRPATVQALQKSPVRVGICALLRVVYESSATAGEASQSLESPYWTHWC